MMIDKKGLSTVVTTLIIILLVLVAIGIVWVVVRGLIGTTETQINIQQKCIGIDLEITSATCGTGKTLPCIVVVKKVGGETPTGVQVIAYDASGSVSNKNVTIGGLTTNALVEGNAASIYVITKVAAAAYFDDGTNRAFCSQVVESTNIN